MNGLDFLHSISITIPANLFSIGWVA